MFLTYRNRIAQNLGIDGISTNSSLFAYQGTKDGYNEELAKIFYLCRGGVVLDATSRSYVKFPQH